MQSDNATEPCDCLDRLPRLRQVCELLHDRVLLKAHADELTERAAAQVQRMHARNSLAEHGTDNYVIHSLAFLATRLRRDNPLTEAFDECKRIEDKISSNFENFYPDLLSYVADWKQQH